MSRRQTKFTAMLYCLLITFCFSQRVAGFASFLPRPLLTKQVDGGASPPHAHMKSRKDFFASFGQSFAFIWCASVSPFRERTWALDPTVKDKQNEEKTGPIKPFAAVETLVPAVRVKLMIDNGIDIVSRLKDEQTSDATATLLEVSDLFLVPRNFTKAPLATMLPPKPARQYLKSYEDLRRQLPLVAQPGAILVQQGEIMTWRRLKSKELASEREDEIRAALNVYTNALEYDSTKYALTASPEKRRQLIRNDSLPDVKSVIASDMGLRYLYRNELLSNMDEAKAELRYLIATQKKDEEAVDVNDLLELLTQARTACENWFSFIDPEDVEEALKIVKNEKTFHEVADITFTQEDSDNLLRRVTIIS